MTLSVAALLVVGFAVWAVVQWFEVDSLRDGLASRVRCLSAISSYGRVVQSDPSEGGTGAMAEGVRSRCEDILAPDDPLWPALEGSQPAPSAKAAVARELGEAVTRVRAQSATISRQLGRHWDRLTWLIIGLVALCFATLGLLHLAHRRGQRLEAAQQKLQDLATHDALTRTLNRRVLMERLAHMMAHPDQSLSVLLIDLDHFKRVNDTYGHLAGDRALQEAARICKESLKPTTGLLGRYGGEEFIAVLAGAGYSEARHIAEQLCTAVAMSPIRLGDNNVHLSVSIGVAARQPDTPSPEMLIDRADQALYAAKSAGRNRVA